MGLIKDKIYYTYKDVTIVPCAITSIEHREECIPYDEFGYLPLFTAPMDTVVKTKNFELFENNNIYAILPRTEPLKTREFYSTKGRWAAYSLNEFSDIFCNGEKLPTTHKLKALIDVANGHMNAVIHLVKCAKEKYGDDIVIMAGNIANPKAYEEYAKCGVDYIRCGIGSGRGCLSTSNTGVHMPMATLIDEIATLKEKIKDDYRKLPYIIADGGIRNYDDIIKALALGADYVMVGSVFARMLESAAPKISNMVGKIEEEIFMSADLRYEDDIWKLGKNDLGEICATFYGMASREGQIALNGSKTKTSEGLKTCLKVEYTMSGWIRNFIDYLRSAMSYIGVRSLDDLRTNSKVIINSENAVNAVNK